mgnify:CR=1 FL=1
MQEKNQKIFARVNSRVFLPDELNRDRPGFRFRVLSRFRVRTTLPPCELANRLLTGDDVASLAMEASHSATRQLLEVTSPEVISLLTGQTLEIIFMYSRSASIVESKGSRKD